MNRPFLYLVYKILLLINIKQNYDHRAQYAFPLQGENSNQFHSLIFSVSDPFHFDMDPDPRIRFLKNGSKSDLKSGKYQLIFL